MRDKIKVTFLLFSIILSCILWLYRKLSEISLCIPEDSSLISLPAIMSMSSHSSFYNFEINLTLNTLKYATNTNPLIKIIIWRKILLHFFPKMNRKYYSVTSKNVRWRNKHITRSDILGLCQWTFNYFIEKHNDNGMELSWLMLTGNLSCYLKVDFIVHCYCVSS
jgi:hypothetical protein